MKNYLYIIAGLLIGIAITLVYIVITQNKLLISQAYLSSQIEVVISQNIDIKQELQKPLEIIP